MLCVRRRRQVQEKLLHRRPGRFQMEMFRKLQVRLHVADGRRAGGTGLARTAVPRKGFTVLNQISLNDRLEYFT